MNVLQHRIENDDDEPRPGRPREPLSNAGRLRDFFESNPVGTELTYDDIETRFGMARNTAYNVVRQLEQQGVVESVFVVRRVVASNRENAS